MENTDPTSMKLNRIRLWCNREALRIQGSWELHPVLLTFLYTSTFGFLCGLGTFIFTHSLNQALVAGVLAFFLNGFVFGRACYCAVDPWEVQEKIAILDGKIASALAIKKQVEKEKRLRQEMLQKEQEEQRLEEERRQGAMILAQKAREEAQQKQAQEDAHHEAMQRETRGRQRRRSHGNACWYCRQPLLHGWLQCVFCRMVS